MIFSDNLFGLSTIIIIRAGSSTLAGFEVEFFFILATGFSPWLLSSVTLS